MPYPFLASVNKPSRYLGTEINAVHKDWQQTGTRVALVFPDLYEIGMSHLGLAILYGILNDKKDVLAERVFVPDLDLERLLRANNYPLLSLESRKPLKDFDIIGFTLPYELCYTNLLTVLDLSGIPFRAAERDGRYPLIIAGGSCAVNPEPVADFFDAVLVGDGEEAILEIAEIFASWREGGGNKDQLLENLATVEGVYIPSLFRTLQDSTGIVERIEPFKSQFSKVSRRVVSDLNGAAYPVRPVVSYTRPVHDRISLEISRGCSRGCRFCQAGIIYRPVRERDPQNVLRLVEESLAATGHEEISLLSLSTGDYVNLQPLLRTLMNRHACDHVAISMPSLRVGTLTPEIISEIKRVRKTGFTLAPEAGTERLRNVINKDISAEDLLTTAREAYEAGWNLLKLYFMIGLPTETREDLDGIMELVKRVLRESHSGNRRGQVNVGISTFVPKPHTPFQWQSQISLEESLDRLNYIKSSIRDRRIQIKWHDPSQSFLEGVFSRGDRGLSRLIEAAYHVGCRLDGWGDHFQFSLWQKAAEEIGLDLKNYLRERKAEEILPWSHIDCHVTSEFLRAEALKAIRAEITPDCRKAGCIDCGVCQGEYRMVRLSQPFTDSYVPERNKANRASVRIRINYGKLEEARFLGHLEVTRIFARALKRAGIDLEYSQGFHPMPKMAFSPALPVGTESVAEYIDITILGDMRPVSLALLLQKEMPPGLVIYGAQKTASAAMVPELNYYRIRSTEDTFNASSVKSFFMTEQFPIRQERKGRIRTVDIRPLINNLQFIDARTVALSVSNIGEPGAKPAEMLQSIFDLSEKDIAGLQILKLPGNPVTEQICQES